MYREDIPTGFNVTIATHRIPTATDRHEDKKTIYTKHGPNTSGNIRGNLTVASTTEFEAHVQEVMS